jgi:magnesium transporter
VLNVFVVQDGYLARINWISQSEALPANAIWLDLYRPTPEEERLAEQLLGINIPTIEEMSEIELSNRLYVEDSICFATSSIISGSETRTPEINPVTFILMRDKLITVRYSDPQPFSTFASYSNRIVPEKLSGQYLIAGLIEAIVNRLADIMEKAAKQIDGITRELFVTSPDTAKKPPNNFNQLLADIGLTGDLISKVRESLVSVGRLIGFMNQVPEAGLTEENHSSFRMMAKDITALADHASYLSGRIGFLLDAVLGLINIEQNSIIKFFSVAAVIFLPPTLIASVYGMNFDHMPELQWLYGYPAALLLMLISAIVPYSYFKHKGWL